MPLTLRRLRFYQFADGFSGILIYLMVVFSPWAFGTTLPWSIWVMNACGYSLGLLLLAKLYIRFRHGYRPARWGDLALAGSATTKSRSAGIVTAALALLTVLILGYCLASAVNARATYQRLQGSFAYRDFIPWLPHSYAGNKTWDAFWNYLALALSFWALRDWLLGCSADEARSLRSAHAAPNSSLPASPGPSSVVPGPSSQVSGFRFQISTFQNLPQRLRQLLWILSINGALLAVEGICQRLSGTNKLLWFMPTRINREAISQFGPYAYRSNGAQYLNLVWPATLGLWWTLHRAARRSSSSALTSPVSGRQSPVSDLRTPDSRLQTPDSDLRSQVSHPPSPTPSLDVECSMLDVQCSAPPVSDLRSPSSSRARHLLLPCVIVMATGAIFSVSRGGALVALAGLVGAAAILLFGLRRRHPIVKFGAILFFGAALAVGLGPSWDKLSARMTEVESGFAGRESMNVTARQIAKDYRWLGTGPGTFEPIFQMYRTSQDEYWPAQLHNDWLETRITFGRVGSALIGLAFLLVLARWFAPGGIPVNSPFVMLLWLALGGCLLHARWDFPLQMYSILFLFLLLCAILTTLTSRQPLENWR